MDFEKLSAARYSLRKFDARPVEQEKLDTVYLCLDNDDAGNDACDRMTDTLEDMGLDVERLCPVRKDWNDDLCAKFEKKEKDT